jgi:hypothetical protein
MSDKPIKGVPADLDKANGGRNPTKPNEIKQVPPTPPPAPPKKSS